MFGVFSGLTFLASWLFGQLTFWRLTISPSIEQQAGEHLSKEQNVFYIVIDYWSQFTSKTSVLIHKNVFLNTKES
jgi:hypothetical protein